MAKPKSPKSMGILYDTGALIAADRESRRMWAIHARALQRGVRPIVPVGCIVEDGVELVNRTLPDCSMDVRSRHSMGLEGSDREQ